MSYTKEDSKIAISIILSCFLFFAINSRTFSQGAVSDHLTKTEWLESKDLKIWEKYVSQLDEAEGLLSESNQLYLKLSSTEADETLDEKKKQKSTEKIESEAADKFLKALNKYREIYVGLYNIVLNNINEKDKVHPAYKDMVYYSDQSNMIYKAHSAGETDESRDEFSKANEYQLFAIEKGIDIFTISAQNYSGQDIVTGPTITVGEEEDDDVVIDAELYKKYKKYISDNSIPDPIVVRKLMELEGDAVSYENFEIMWQKYLNEEVVGFEAVAENLQEEGETSAQTTTREDGSGQSSVGSDCVDNQQGTTTTSDFEIKQDLTGTESGGSQTQENQNGTNSNVNDDYSQDGQINQYNQSSTQNSSGEYSQTKSYSKINTGESGTTTPQNGSGAGRNNEMYSTITPDMSGLNEFRIQIAASRSPLSVVQIRSIYKGTQSVTEVKDGKYYKYQIRGYRLLSDAQQACSQIEVDNAYLTAYKESQGVSLSKAAKEVRELEDKVRRSGKKNSVMLIEFVVQIAASRVRLSDNQLGSIYSGNQPLTIVFEEGWYKYQILAGNDLQRALNDLEVCGVPKAFLVGYKNGQKMKLYNALHEYKIYKP